METFKNNVHFFLINIVLIFIFEKNFKNYIILKGLVEKLCYCSFNLCNSTQQVKISVKGTVDVISSDSPFIVACSIHNGTQNTFHGQP